MSDQPQDLCLPEGTEGCGRCAYCRLSKLYQELELDETVSAELIVATLAKLLGMAISRWPLPQHQASAWAQAWIGAEEALQEGTKMRSAAGDLYRRLREGNVFVSPIGRA